MLQCLSAVNGATFDLLFYASFADKILAIMRREGKDANGFERMQQSFREGVEQVRAQIKKAADLGYSRGSSFLELSPTGMASILELIHDLAIVKDWKNPESEPG